MQLIPPDTIRVVIPKGTEVRGRRLAVDTAVDITIGRSELYALARAALQNRTRRSRDGALSARPLGDVLLEDKEPA